MSQLVRSLRPYWGAVLLLLCSGVVTFVLFRGGINNILVLTLININLVLTFIALLLLARNLVKLYYEKRQRRATFKGRLVAAFLSLSMIPTLLLFVVAGGFLTNSIENWFSIQVEQSLDHSLEVAQQYYQKTQNDLTTQARHLAGLIAEQNLLSAPPSVWEAFREKKTEEYGIRQMHLVASSSSGVEIKPPLRPEFLARARSSTGPVSTIQSTFEGDWVRAAVRVGAETGDALLVIDTLIPAGFVAKMEQIKRASESYAQLSAFKNPIKGSYLLSFFIIALLILFSAVWFGIYLARGITVPIQRLAEGTQKIARGDLDVRIDVHSTDEFGMLVDAFNRMASDLKQSQEALVRAQKLATWQEMARQIAHEIKNPLTPIQLATERLRKKYAEGAPDFDRIFDEATRTVIAEVHGLKTLVDAFSQFARMPAAQPMPQAIDPIIREAVALYETGGVHFMTQFDPTTPPLNLDRDQIKRLFVNLFENAIDAMNGQGTLSVITAHRDRTVSVAVSDDGAGVAPDDLEKLFLPYFSRKKTGTGLGLAIVNRIVLDHHAQIRVAPGQTRGTTFILEFPV
jgi:nitrogen fixation/metabolism regulation signal transduction histidine kinase